ncbi:MAG: hypothetical protein HFP77_03050 [Methylococcales symbiont of Iophon sp. n. MRB-2018]|nr:MAG: hypothetical protein HFP77_03050 [Methylococcales symbiont of Iophon sp. n. MRB-2018]KAF3980334.1 MAG: hypothetical protein HFP76_02635 [Methylococcales symbiont of Iophon sp. n. MRB-2018]
MNALSDIEFKEIIKKHLIKANYLVHKKDKLPDEIIEQVAIFSVQKRQYISQDMVAILSALPLFYLDYKGVKNLQL